MPENQDNQDYDYVIGKLPRKDKDGRDTTKDKMGKGGRHREDGTFSSMPYDLEVLDSDPTKLAQESTPIITPPKFLTSTTFIRFSIFDLKISVHPNSFGHIRF